jgi:hypothetical protein
MNTFRKHVEDLKISDLERFPVWEYANSDSAGETLVKPVRRLPVKSLKGKIVGVQVQLSNGQKNWAIIGNVDVDNPRLTEHFITLSLECNGEWFTLARYHDFDYQQNGPEALAVFLKIKIEKIFPILYDLTGYSLGEKSALVGSILREPREKLSRSEIMGLAVP